MLFPIFVFGNNRNKRSARGADPTTARTPLATRLSRSLGLSRYNRGSRAVRGGYAYAARYARVIPVIALGTPMRTKVNSVVYNRFGDFRFRLRGA